MWEKSLVSTHLSSKCSLLPAHLSGTLILPRKTNPVIKKLAQHITSSIATVRNSCAINSCQVQTLSMALCSTSVSCCKQNCLKPVMDNLWNVFEGDIKHTSLRLFYVKDNSFTVNWVFCRMQNTCTSVWPCIVSQFIGRETFSDWFNISMR